MNRFNSFDMLHQLSFFYDLPNLMALTYASALLAKVSNPKILVTCSFPNFPISLANYGYLASMFKCSAHISAFCYKRYPDF